MKKLLATLLVAVMIMSCMSVVSFAASVTLTTQATFPYADMDNDNGKTGSRWALTDAGALVLYNDYYEGEGSGVQAYYDANGTYMGYVPQVGDYIVVPYYISEPDVGIVWFNSQLTYNANLFEYVEFVGPDGWTASVPYNENGLIKFGGTGSAITDADTSLFVFVFKIKAAVDSDENPLDQKTTEKFVFSDANITASGASSQEAASLAVATMNIEIGGLTAGEEAGDDYIAAEDIAAPVAVQGSYADYSAEKSAYTIVSGDGNEMAEGMVYTAMFATVENSDDYAEYGVALKSTGGYLHYAAMTEGDKFGILLFGENDLMANYNACTYVKYADGTVVYVANVVAVR